jgi:CRISPR system Cascade subunit CasA
VELTTSLRPGRRWLDAVPRLLAHRQQVLAGPLRYDPTGIVLCWQEPWDGKTALSLEALDPFFVEVSRRVRIVERRGRLAAFTWPSHVPRIEAEALNGVVGDPWEPVDLKKPGKNGNPKVLTPGPQGLDPDLLRRLIFQDGLQMSALQSPGDDWRGDSWLVVSVLVRGQGTTDGFHERVIPIPPPVRACLFGPMERRQSLAALAKGAVEYGGKMRRFVLWPSLNTLVGAGTSTGRDADEAWAATWTRRFDRSWADDLFPWLWRQAGSPEARVLDQEWFPILRERAFAVLRGAMDSMPQRVGRRYKARAVAESEFRRRLFAKNAFADLKGAVGHDSSAAV